MTDNINQEDVTPVRHIPANLAPHIFRPGVSGNPGGKGGEIAKAQAYAREKSVAAMEKLAHLMETSRDERVVVICANSLLDRAMGKPKEIKETGEANLSRRLSLQALLATASTDELKALRGFYKKVADLQAEADDGPIIDGDDQ
jgi:hypothetical protein